jgi:hypothetical protein
MFSMAHSEDAGIADTRIDFASDRERRSKRADAYPYDAMTIERASAVSEASENTQGRTRRRIGPHRRDRIVTKSGLAAG